MVPNPIEESDCILCLLRVEGSNMKEDTVMESIEWGKESQQFSTRLFKRNRTIQLSIHAGRSELTRDSPILHLNTEPSLLEQSP